MSEYSQMLGSFERTGNYPMEANYIFATEQELTTFFNDNINKETIHAGLFRVVLDDGDNKQALYWAYTDENEEFAFKKILTTDSIDELLDKIQELREDLDGEESERINYDEALQELSDSLQQQINDTNSLLNNTIADLKATVGTDGTIQDYLQTLPYENLTEIANALDKFLNQVDAVDTNINTLPELQEFLSGYTDQDHLSSLLQNIFDTIYGTPLPTAEFRTLRAIEDFVRAFKSESINSDIQLHTELDQTQQGVGLNGDGSFPTITGTNYINSATSVIDALRVLDGQIHTAIANYNITAVNEDVVDLTVTRSALSQSIKAVLKLSPQEGNQLQKKSDGLYYNTQLEYSAGTVTLKVNNNIVSQFNVGINGIVQDATYDSANEELVITFKLHDGTTQVVRINVGALIREWDVQNSTNSPIVLTKTVTIGTGTDTLSASAKISNNANNILTVTDGNLEVLGLAQSIKYNDSNVKATLDSLIALVATKANQTDLVRVEGKADTNATSISTLGTTVASNTRAIADEVSRATAAEQQNASDIEDLQDEISRIDTAINTTNGNVSALTTRVTTLENNRTSDLATLNNRINTLETKHDTDIQTLTDDWNDDFDAFSNQVNSTLVEFQRQLITWEEYE